LLWFYPNGLQTQWLQIIRDALRQREALSFIEKEQGDLAFF
jgi:hypothetical protein